MNNNEFKKLLQDELIDCGYNTTEIVKIDEVNGETIIYINGGLYMSCSDDRLLFNWFDKRFQNGVRLDENNSSRIIVNMVTENSKDLYLKSNSPDKMPYPVESCKMKGTPGHCTCAQIFDSEGLSMMTVDSRYGAEKASRIAKETELAINCTYGSNVNPEMIQKAINACNNLIEVLAGEQEDEAELAKSYDLIVVYKILNAKKALENIKLNKEA